MKTQAKTQAEKSDKVTKFQKTGSRLTSNTGTAVPEKIMDRIRKCFALANCAGATIHEAEAAVSQAKKLMAEYNLNMTDVERKEEVQAGAQTSKAHVGRKEFKPWERYMAHVCDVLFSTGHYYTWVDDGKDKRGFTIYRQTIAFVGVGQDSAVAAEAYKILVGVVFKMGSSQKYEPSYGAEFNSYCMGVVTTLLRRAKEAKIGTEAQENECRGIMVVKNQVVTAHLQTLQLKPARKSNMDIRGNAYHQGVKDGHKVSLNFTNSLEVK